VEPATCLPLDSRGGLRLRRLGPLDKALFALLVPIWAVCFGLCLRSVARPALLPPLAVRAIDTWGYPVLTDIAPWGDSETGVRRGDRLVRLGDSDLRGVGPWGFYTRFVAEARYDEPLPLVIYERDGRRGETRIPTPISSQPPLLASLGFACTALVLALRAAPSPLARSLSRASMFTAVATASPVTGGVALNSAGLAVGAVAWSLVFPLFLRALLLFVRTGPPASAWDRLWPWIFASYGPLTVSNFAGVPISRPIGIRLMLLVLLTCFVVILVQVARAYSRMDAVGRRQIRWLALGIYAGLAPTATVVALLLIDGFLFGEWRRFQPLLVPSYSFAVLIPLSFLVATVRYGVLDVDRLLSATASYNVVLAIAVGTGLAVVPRLGAFSSQLIGVDPSVGQIAFSLVLAAIVVPAHQRLRPRIERIFFKDRYALDRGIAELLRALSGCENARALTERVGSELHQLLHPDTCVVYARGGEAFAPVFVEGRGVPPAFEAGSPLIAALRQRGAPLALSDAGRRPDTAELGPFDRAALEALQAEVVVPVAQGQTLLAFLCFGPKRSGDVYTSTDLSHLAAVAEAVSNQLRHFDQQEVIRETRAMAESLRRYVPGAIAEQLESGIELAPSEREVSVLFVDIRGYTSFAEPRGAEEIFSTINRYTGAVSEIVRKHGGSVVEFNGDGMMAVFGAPRDLPHKERAAVDAGRKIVTAVALLWLTDPQAGDAELSVGVGIATGEAFVGSIRAADRMIWSAIGNTTNLAARLQALSRDLDTTLVIDTPTWRGLDAADDAFERHAAIAIRGRRQAQDLYCLRPPASVPRAAASPSSGGTPA